MEELNFIFNKMIMNSINRVIRLSLAIGVIGSVGCSPYDSNKKIDNTNKETDKIALNNIEAQHIKQMINEFKHIWEEGGQPGKILISGAIVKDDSQLDNHITLLSKGGVGKDGTESPVQIQEKQILSSNISEENIKSVNSSLSSAENREVMAAVGCDENWIESLNKEKKLSIRKNTSQPPSAISSDSITDNDYTKDLTLRLVIEANTVVLCGKLEEINYLYITIIADEIILNNVDYVRSDFYGSFKLIANKLELIGKNQIQLKGPEQSIVLPMLSSIEVNIIKGLSSTDQSGHLTIFSTGSNYKANDTK